MSEETKKAPAIRFQGFSDAWEQRKLGDTFEFSVSTNSLSRAQLNYEKGNIKSIHYGDILIKYNSILEITKDKIPFITDGSIEKYKPNLLENGDVVFADAAEDETVGKAVEINGISDEYVVAGLHTIVARPKEKMAKYFSGYYINADVYQRQLLRLMQGTKVSSISKGNLKKTIVAYPKNLAEQQKIGSFFKQLDNAIALHQRKLSLLEQLKQTYLQVMFPQGQDSIPILRFAGHSEPWEQHKLGEISESYSGGTPSVAIQSYYGGSIPFIRSAEINSKNTELYLTEEGLNNSSAKLVDVGDILYALYGATSGEVGISQINGAINQAILAIKPKIEYDSNFIMQWLRRQKMSIISTYLQGGQGNLSGSIVKDLALYAPTKQEEQTKIGSFFQQLDDTSALHQEKIAHLKILKSTLLNKMFI